MNAKRIAITTAFTVAALGAAGTAAARDVYWSVGVQAAPGVSVNLGNARPVVVAPAPVYYPAPVVVQQAPVVVHPAPVYLPPPPVISGPRPVFYSPAPVYVSPGYGYYRPHHHHHHGWDRR